MSADRLSYYRRRLSLALHVSQIAIDLLSISDISERVFSGGGGEYHGVGFNFGRLDRGKIRLSRLRG